MRGRVLIGPDSKKIKQEKQRCFRTQHELPAQVSTQDRRKRASPRRQRAPQRYGRVPHLRTRVVTLCERGVSSDLLPAT